MITETDLPRTDGFNIKLYDKNSESDYIFLHQNQNIFFSNIGNQIFFLEKKKHNPPPLCKLNGRSLSEWKVKAPIPSSNKVINKHIQVDLYMSVYIGAFSDKLDSRSLSIVDLN